MWFHSLPDSPKARPPAAGRLHVEALEDRSVPSATLFSDSVGDFLATYTGAQVPGLDVVAHQVVLLEDSVVVFGRMAGPIAPTQDVGGLYLIGLDRGRGTARFLTGTPAIGP